MKICHVPQAVLLEQVNSVCLFPRLIAAFVLWVCACLWVCVTHPGRCCSSWRWSLGGAGPAEWNDIQTSTAWCSSPACWLSPSPPCFLTAGSGVQGESGERGGRKRRYRDELKAGKSKGNYGRELECYNIGRKPGRRWKVRQRKKNHPTRWTQEQTVSHTCSAMQHDTSQYNQGCIRLKWQRWPVYTTWHTHTVMHGSCVRVCMHSVQLVPDCLSSAPVVWCFAAGTL